MAQTVKVGDRVKDTRDGHIHTVLQVKDGRFITDHIVNCTHNIPFSALGKEWIKVSK